MNNSKKPILFFIALLSIISFSFCESAIHEKSIVSSDKDSIQSPFIGTPYKVMNREKITSRLKEKITQKRPLIIHALVPLCDNEHQGIVPVNKSLGDGLSLRTNLYWGAGYGVKSYFKRYDNWKLLTSKIDSSGNVLERVIFHKKTSNGISLYLIADGYRGDRMKECLHDYFRALSGWKSEVDSINGQALNLYADADLLVFNGHDGLMDDTLKRYYSKDSIDRETVTIACYSKVFFNSRFEECGAYPLVGTSGLLAPEAYVLSAVIEAWANQKTTLEIKNAAGDAYHGKHPSTTTKSARGLFTTGW